MKFKTLKMYNWMIVTFVCAFVLGLTLRSIPNPSIQSDKDSYRDSQVLIKYLAQSNNMNVNAYGSGYLYYIVNNTDYAISCYQRITGDSTFQTCCRDGQVTYKNVIIDGQTYFSYEIIAWNSMVYNDECYDFDFAKDRYDNR